MDIDFHFYLTLIATKLVGYTFDQAVSIAFAAQYVDENNPKKVMPLNIHVEGFGSFPYDFQPLSTVDSELDLATTIFPDRHRQVWLPFHFLPGNYKSRPTERTYHTLRGSSKKAYEPQDMIYLTRPLSPTVVDMVNDLSRSYNNSSSQDVALYQIGVAIHAFVDAYAHQDFAGLPSKPLNNVGATTYVSGSDGRMVRVPIHKWYTGPYTAPPFGLFGIENAYTGHGRIGHWPDASWLKFQYSPGWHDGLPLVRDNPSTYLHAFVQMVHALTCVRQGSPYKPLILPENFGWDDLPKSVQSVISEKTLNSVADIIRSPPGLEGALWDWNRAMDLKVKEWKRLFKALFSRECPTYQEVKKQIEDMPRNLRSDVSEVVKFNVAAKQHYRSIDEILNQRDMQITVEHAYDQTAHINDNDILFRKKGKGKHAEDLLLLDLLEGAFLASGDMSKPDLYFLREIYDGLRQQQSKSSEAQRQYIKQEERRHQGESIKYYATNAQFKKWDVHPVERMMKLLTENGDKGEMHDDGTIEEIKGFIGKTRGPREIKVTTLFRFVSHLSKRLKK